MLGISADREKQVRHGKFFNVSKRRTECTTIFSTNNGVDFQRDLVLQEY